MNGFDLRDFTIVGHRGARAHAPENTLAGMAEAAARGARWVELDVKLTRDNVPILMHDETLTATAGIDRRVAEADFAYIAALDTLPSFRASYPEAGRAFVARHGSSPVRIPSLEQAVALAVLLGLGLNLEIKPCPGRDIETAGIALALARLLWPIHRLPPLVSSFSVASLDAALRIASDWPRGLLLDRPRPDWREEARRLEVSTINVNAARLTERGLAMLCAARLPVLAWTVNQPERARVLRRWGVAGIFTDRPGLLAGG